MKAEWEREVACVCNNGVKCFKHFDLDMHILNEAVKTDAPKDTENWVDGSGNPTAPPEEIGFFYH